MYGKERNSAFMFDRKKYQQGLERHDRISMFGWTIPLNNHSHHRSWWTHSLPFSTPRLKDGVQTV